MNEPVWTYRMGCSGWLAVIVFAALVIAFFVFVLMFILGFFITYALVSVAANMIAGPDPVPSP